MERWDPLIDVIKDREKISEFMQHMREVMSFLHDKEAWSEVKTIDEFFQRNIIDHFEFEEQKVFPTILLKAATRESVNLILELQKEHGIIHAKLEEFRRMVPQSAIPSDEEASAELNSLARTIIDMLLRHAAKEDDALIPIIEKNRRFFD